LQPYRRADRKPGSGAGQVQRVETDHSRALPSAAA
jgi:hypothetical protein